VIYFQKESERKNKTLYLSDNMARKRRKKYYIDPITGQKREIGATYNPITGRKIPKGYYEHPITGELIKKSKRKSRQPYYREPEFNFNDLPPWAQLTIALVILGVLVWIFIIQSFMEWAKQNIAMIITVLTIILIVLIVGFALHWRYRKKKEAKKRKFEEEQKAKGLIKFVDRFGNERWGKPNEVDKWRKEDEKAREKEKLINQVVETIKGFKPARKYKNEFPYQVELAGYLKSKFPHVNIEQQRGSSRPDIVIGNIAIEVKGPTRNQDLKTIADKCMRYYQHFGELIIVLFEIDVYEPRYEEWEKGMKNTFPNVRIIRK